MTISSWILVFIFSIAGWRSIVAARRALQRAIDETISSYADRCCTHCGELLEQGQHGYCAACRAVSRMNENYLDILEAELHMDGQL